MRRGKLRTGEITGSATVVISIAANEKLLSICCRHAGGGALQYDIKVNDIDATSMERNETNPDYTNGSQREHVFNVYTLSLAILNLNSSGNLWYQLFTEEHI